MNVRSPQYRQGSKKAQFVLALILAISLMIVGFVFWWVYDNTQQTEDTSSNNQPVSSTEEKGAESTTEVADSLPTFDAEKLQGVIDDWLLTLPRAAESNASVVIADSNGEQLAGFKVDRLYFAASIYKLHVAYEGYRAIDAKQVGPDEPYQSGRTRIECLDAMIRDSDSPCAEKMWLELGKEELTSTLESYGMQNTSMTGLQTTAQDTAIMLARIASGEGLSTASQASYLDSMKIQDARYRRGLPSGFSSAVVVYNKVGWNEQLEYHDAAIVELPDSRRLIVVVMSSQVGASRLSDLATRLEATF